MMIMDVMLSKYVHMCMQSVKETPFLQCGHRKKGNSLTKA